MANLRVWIISRAFVVTHRSAECTACKQRPSNCVLRGKLSSSLACPAVQNMSAGKASFLVANTGELTAMVRSSLVVVAHTGSPAPHPQQGETPCACLQGPISGSAVLVKVDGKTAASISDKGSLSISKIDAGSAKLVRHVARQLCRLRCMRAEPSRVQDTAMRGCR